MNKFLLLFVSIIVIACQNNSTNGAPGCDFTQILPSRENADCGYITVPENHDQPDGKKINIAYTILRSSNSDAEPFPVIFLSGGPGGSALDSSALKFWFNHPFRAERDIIIFDQRGIGYSSALPNMDRELFEIMAKDATEQEEQSMINDLMEQYRKKCENLGIDLRQYNTFQNAQDVGDLMKHLGYTKYNLYGVSYGTRLARVVQDKYPEELNAVILNSPNPIKGDMLIDRLKSYELALSRVIEYCKNNPECNTANPSLQENYLKAINGLKENPLVLNINGDSVFINANDGLFFVRRLLYGTNSRTMIPALINEYLNGGGPIITNLVSNEYGPNYNFSMWFAVERHEMYDSKNTEQVIDKVYETLPLLPARLGLFNAAYLGLGKFHESGIEESKKIFQMSDVPTLITVNRFDPVTPPENGQILMERLTHGHLFILDEGGHGGGDAECRNEVMSAFMDNPSGSLDASCLNIYKE